jgi:hypothetical protein
VFPFETTLPLNLPSSYYDRKVAKISYVITSIMKKRLFFEKAETEFQVKRNYDFSLYPTLKCPIENSRIFDLNLNQSISVNFVLLQGKSPLKFLFSSKDSCTEFFFGFTLGLKIYLVFFILKRWIQPR